MTSTRTTSFTWNVVADSALGDRLGREMRHAVNRICNLSTNLDPGKHHLLIHLSRTNPNHYEVQLTLRHGRFLSHVSDQGLALDTIFEVAAAKLEDVFKRRRRYRGQRQPSAGDSDTGVEPNQRTDRRAPQSAQDVLAEMIGDYVRRLRRHVRRRLRTESIVHPETPVSAISDGDVVDDAVVRMLKVHPAKIPFGAFWPWAIHVCEEVVRENVREAERLATSSVSLDEDLPPREDWEPGFDVEQPFYIIERMLYPPEDELEDATADEHASAPSTVAEYEDFIRYLHRQLAGWPERQRRIVEQYCFEGLHLEEIATLEGMDEPEVGAVLNDSLSELRRIMAGTDDARD